MKQVDEGIFLFRTSYSETSLIATFYTNNHGTKKFIFKGGKKKSHNLFPLAISEITFYERDESDLSNLTGADPVLRQEIQFDPVRSTIAFFMAEVIRKSIETNEKDPELYDFLIQTITGLDKTKDLSVYPIKFLTGFSLQLGIQPLIESNRPIINYQDGTIGVGSNLDANSEEGDHIQLLVDLFKENAVKVYPKEIRMQALRSMIKYYGFHVPRMEQMETLEILHEILS